MIKKKKKKVKYLKKIFYLFSERRLELNTKQKQTKKAGYKVDYNKLFENNVFTFI